MEKTKKHTWLWCVVLGAVLLVAVLWCGVWYAADPDRLDYSSNENPYEALPTPETMSIVGVSDIKTVLITSDEVVIARATESTHEEIFTFEKDGSMPELEKLYPGDTVTTTREVTQMEVVQSFGGSLQAGDTFDYEVAEGFLGCFPAMQPGDTYLLMLNHSTLSEDGYASTALHCSFFYVTEENTVYPSYLVEAFQKYNGMPVEEFARVIHKHWKGYATAF